MLKLNIAKAYFEAMTTEQQYEHMAQSIGDWVHGELRVVGEGYEVDLHGMNHFETIDFSE